MLTGKEEFPCDYEEGLGLQIESLNVAGGKRAKQKLHPVRTE